jgi:DNA-binding MarR family transcriptional regulator
MKTTAQMSAAASRAATTSLQNGTGSAVAPLPLNLSYRLSYLSFLMNRTTYPVLAAHGLSNQQWKVLSVLCQLTPATAQEITHWVTLDKSAVSRTVRSLLERNLITRKLHSQDARHVHLFVTPKGNALYRRLSMQLAAVQAEVMQDVSAPARAVLFKALRKVEERLWARLDSHPGEDAAMSKRQEL